MGGRRGPSLPKFLEPLELFVFFILAVAAAESAVGLAILVLIYRKRKSIDVDGLSMLKG